MPNASSKYTMKRIFRNRPVEILVCLIPIATSVFRKESKESIAGYNQEESNTERKTRQYYKKFPLPVNSVNHTKSTVISKIIGHRL